MTYLAKVISDSIVAPLGFSTVECFDSMVSGQTGLKYLGSVWDSTEPITTAKIERDAIEKYSKIYGIDESKYTFFERLAIVSVCSALKNTAIDVSGSETIFILSTTKGNIDLLEDDPFDKRLNLFYSAKAVSEFFKNANRPVVVSNACVSGVAALGVAKRYINNGTYKRAVVIGADILTKFVVSGFQSFKALSQQLCKPFDKERCGLNIGEGAAAVVLEATERIERGDIIIQGFGMANDANHISGPSRTGEGLFRAILQARGAENEKIDFINTHGTATLYNDEMESIALYRQSLLEPPLSSFKGYFGHTLGAAGVIESIVCFESMRRGLLIGTKGFNELGVTQPVNILKNNTSCNINRTLKTASGFGGSNAAIVITKI